MREKYRAREVHVETRYPKSHLQTAATNNDLIKVIFYLFKYFDVRYILQSIFECKSFRFLMCTIDKVRSRNVNRGKKHVL